mmetsp:Transcript_15198/g.38079  ORF Transcript_15198/g.38079 Transcript_15198/m.38079 type:complete len:202 (+) Transcript_15198:253-858(+)
MASLDSASPAALRARSLARLTRSLPVARNTTPLASRARKALLSVSISSSSQRSVSSLPPAFRLSPASQRPAFLPRFTSRLYAWEPLTRPLSRAGLEAGAVARCSASMSALLMRKVSPRARSRRRHEATWSNSVIAGTCPTAPAIRWLPERSTVTVEWKKRRSSAAMRPRLRPGSGLKGLSRSLAHSLSCIAAHSRGNSMPT